MLLAIDVGNSATKLYWGDPSGDPRVHRWFDNCSSTKEFLESLRPYLNSFREKGELDFCSVASVVPSLNSFLKAELDELGICHRFLDASTAPGVRIKYETPETVGADRIANAIYLTEKLTVPAVAVDFGTATNMDVVDAEGSFLGGAILPGPSSMFSLLSNLGTRFSDFELEPPTHAIGRSTKECLQSGTVLALAKAVEGLLEEFRREPGTAQAGMPADRGAGKDACVPLDANAPLNVIATGGFASLMAPLCPSIQRVEPNLTLEGLLIAAQRWASED